jgi:MFS family permease
MQARPPSFRFHVADGEDGEILNERYGARALARFFAANVLFAAGLFAHAFLYNFYLESVGEGASLMGGAAASLTAGGLTALIPAGRLVDRRGPAIVYQVATLLAAAGLAASAFVISPAAIYATGFLAGAGTAGWRVAMAPAIMRLAAARTRSRAFSWNVALLVASGSAWTAISGASPSWFEARGLGQTDSLRVVLAAGALLTLLALAILPRHSIRHAAGEFDAATSADESDPIEKDAAIDGAAEAGPGENDALRPTRDATGQDRTFDPAYGSPGPGSLPKGFASVILVVAFWMGAAALVLPFFNVFFQREHGLEIGRIGAIFGAAQLVTAALLAVSAEASARAGPRRVLLTWTVLFAPALLALAWAGSPGLAVALYFVAGFVPPATNPLIDQVLLEDAPPERHGIVSTWRNAATEVSGLAGASLGGILLQATSFRALLSVAACVAAAGAVALAIALKRFNAPPGLNRLRGHE